MFPVVVPVPLLGDAVLDGAINHRTALPLVLLTYVNEFVPFTAGDIVPARIGPGTGDVQGVGAYTVADTTQLLPDKGDETVRLYTPTEPEPSYETGIDRLAWPAVTDAT